MMETFDYPEMGPNCLSRSVSTASPQSLMLMNSEHVRELATSFADRVETLLRDKSSKDFGDTVNLVYQLALIQSHTSYSNISYNIMDSRNSLEIILECTSEAYLVKICKNSNKNI